MDYTDNPWLNVFNMDYQPIIHGMIVMKNHMTDYPWKVYTWIIHGIITYYTIISAV